MSGYTRRQPVSVHKWSEAELSELGRLRDVEGLDFDAIAAVMGLDVSKCKTQYYNRVRRSVRVVVDAGTNVKASAAQYAERDARQEARLRRDEVAQARGDHTAAFFGDPLPGYSALDKRRGC